MPVEVTWVSYALLYKFIFLLCTPAHRLHWAETLSLLFHDAQTSRRQGRLKSIHCAHNTTGPSLQGGKLASSTHEHDVHLNMMWTWTYLRIHYTCGNLNMMWTWTYLRIHYTCGHLNMMCTWRYLRSMMMTLCLLLSLACARSIYYSAIRAALAWGGIANSAQCGFDLGIKCMEPQWWRQG